VYRINTLWPIVEALESLSGRKYDEQTVPMRVITDHLRGAAILATDGVVPGNKTQAYVMRRLVRRALRYALDLDLTQGLAESLVPVIADTYADEYPEVAAQRDRIIEVLSTEERTFARTLRKGLTELRRRGRDGATLDGTDLFELHDTFGMPVELSAEETGRSGIGLAPTWQAEYTRLREEQRARSRAGRR
jgi:alanyl-tRNA synthetase